LAAEARKAFQEFREQQERVVPEQPGVGETGETVNLRQRAIDDVLPAVLKKQPAVGVREQACPVREVRRTQAGGGRGIRNGVRRRQHARARQVGGHLRGGQAGEAAVAVAHQDHDPAGDQVGHRLFGARDRRIVIGDRQQRHEVGSERRAIGEAPAKIAGGGDDRPQPEDGQPAPHRAADRNRAASSGSSGPADRR